jgi:hypothetical protein
MRSNRVEDGPTEHWLGKHDGKERLLVGFESGAKELRGAGDHDDE